MKKVLKLIGFIVAGLVGLVIVVAAVISAVTIYRLNRTYDVTVETVAIPNDAETLERGEHLVRAIAGCDGCHGKNLGGMVLLDDPAIMTFSGPNLTAGIGGAGSRLSDEDWVRTIRHGVDPVGKPLLLMPAQN
jgi:mono/diheme cytochrome c family protein